MYIYIYKNTNIRSSGISSKKRNSKNSQRPYVLMDIIHRIRARYMPLFRMKTQGMCCSDTSTPLRSFPRSLIPFPFEAVMKSAIHLRADSGCLGFLSRSTSIWYLARPQWFDYFASAKDISCFTLWTEETLDCFFVSPDIELCCTCGHTSVSDVTAELLPLTDDRKHLLWHDWLDCGRTCRVLSPQRTVQQQLSVVCLDENISCEHKRGWKGS